MDIDVNKVSERLKATKLPENRKVSAAERAGIAAGKKWAAEAATADELDLATGYEMFVGEPMLPLTWSHLLYADIEGIDIEDVDSADLVERSEKFYGQWVAKPTDEKHITATNFAIGFQSGAAEILDLVNDADAEVKRVEMLVSRSA